MGDGRRGQKTDVRGCILLAESACHEQKKQYFDKFAGLESHSRDRKADFGSVCDRAQKQHGSKRYDAGNSIEIGPLAKQIQLVAKQREHQQEEDARQRDQKLLLRLVVVDPRDHDETYAQHHENIVEHEHIRVLI